MNPTSDHDLCSAAATFTPRHAFLNLPPLHKDPGAINALHEIAHAETFSGAAFYASFAARTLKGEAVPIRPLREFLEAIPDAFQHVGGRSAPGSGPDHAVVYHLVTIANRYVADFGDIWREIGFDFRTATSAAAAIGEVNSSQLVGRTLIQIVARCALELALVRAGGKAPEGHVRALYERLETHQPLPMPGPGEGIQDHIQRLMRKSPRKIVGMFDDQLLLADVLLNADQTTLLELRPLLSAVVGLEYFTQWWPPQFQTLFFAHPTADFGNRLQRYVAARARSPSHEQVLLQRLGNLAIAIAPVRDRKPILVDPDHAEDPRAHTAFELLSLQSYIVALPHFCESHLQDAPMIGSSCSGAINALKKTSEQAFEAYVSLIAKQANCPELSILLKSVVLRPAKSSDGREVLLLRV
ncbi:hypothetical protein [Methylocystis sp. SC2]|uniref:hypothetical protein n=1 Tax=Methylocystis sp. (strain SC2) TaxID=187303 RepID=UPI00027AEA5E|nr:hypothetical protein [Methylocystis sp. SC2]CCJ05616.1 Hypothetical protein BN69_0165 [Methylocystis sp. SC2]